MYQDELVAARLKKIHLAGALGRSWRRGRTRKEDSRSRRKELEKEQD